MAVNDLVVRLKQRLDQRIEDGLPKAASILESAMREQCPQASGRLAESISSEVEGNTITASSPLPYAGIQNARSGFARRAFQMCKEAMLRALVGGGK